MLVSTLLTAVLAARAALAAPAPQADDTPVDGPSSLPPDDAIWFGRPLYWNYNLGLCMAAEGSYPGARVVLTTDCYGSTTPNNYNTWDVGPFSGQILNNQTGLCLDAGDYNSVANGVQLRVQPCSTSPIKAQTWWYPTNPDNAWRRIELAGGPCLKRTNMCADLEDGRQAKGTPVQLWQCYANNPNQVWDLGRWCRSGC